MSIFGGWAKAPSVFSLDISLDYLKKILQSRVFQLFLVLFEGLLIVLLIVNITIKGFSNESVSFQDLMAYLIGYLFVIVIASIFIKNILEQTHSLIYTEFPREKEPEKARWLPVYMGVIERILYVSSLLSGYGEFILAWVVLKMTVPYLRWKIPDEAIVKSDDDKKDNKAKDDKHLFARTLYINSLSGNALSILYAFIGYKIIDWIKNDHYFYTAFVILVTCLGTIILYFYFDKVYKKLHEKLPSKGDPQ